MIQRKQTLFWILGILVITLTLFVPFGNKAVTDATGNAVSTEITTNYNILLISLVAVAIGLMGFCIFLFKNRKLQKSLSWLATLICAAIAGLEIYYILSLGAQANYNVGLAKPFLAMMLCGTAVKFVQKDINLLKSVDRLRD